MILAYRIVKERHADTAFSGLGARIAGGRWNRLGEPVVYASSTIALAALETFVHLQGEARAIRFVFFEIGIPDDLPMARCKRPPRDWRASPPARSTMNYGSRWFRRGETALLNVPSVLVPIERNFVLNPQHTDFARIKISLPRKFAFDARLWDKDRLENR